MPPLTVTQNRERAKGAALERKAITAQIRKIIKMYRRDVVLEGLLDWIKERDPR